MTQNDNFDVPGTLRIFHDSGESAPNHGEITLIPTPSDDPQDPLNWSRGRKLIQIACLLWYTFASAFSVASLSAIYVPLTEATGLTLDQLNAGSGYSYFLIGLSTLIFQPAALAYGKRPVYILSNVAACGLQVWTAYVSGNSQWIARCLLLGFMGGPSFSLVEVSIADISFLHERATPMGLYVCVLYLGALLGPMVCGYVYTGLGWKAIIWLTSALYGANAMILLIFLEETNFKCAVPYLSSEATLNLPVKGGDDCLPLSEGGVKDDDLQDKVSPDTQAHAAIPVASPRPISSWPGPNLRQFGKLSPYSKGIMWRGLVQPLALTVSPIVFCCGIIYGIYQVYFNMIAYLSSGVLSYPPYNFSADSVGLTYLSPAITTLPGAFFGGYVADWYTLRMARANNGICEPEHKLRLFAIPTILVPIGLLMMGLGPYYGAHWIVYVLGEGVLNAAGPLATTLILAYAFDCFHPIYPDDLTGVHASVQDAAPYLTATISIAMCLTFGFGYAITPWAFTWGLKNFAISAALSSLAFNGLVLLLYIFGKRLRRSGHQYYRKVINW
ncbi:hypothetical protein V866_000373 [Kwoniella sp. B9012]